MTDRIFIIAEAGVNHNGDIDKAFKLIDVAAECGADAVKFQTFKTSRLTTAMAETCIYQRKAMNGIRSQQNMLSKLELNNEDYINLKKYCDSKNIEFMSTAFDTDSLEFLVAKTGLKRIKISSGEMVNPFILLYAARKGLPIILSTGLATTEEIRKALSILCYGYIYAEGVPDCEKAYSCMESARGKEILLENVTVLHCTSEYPAPQEDINLSVMPKLKKLFNLPVGYSDHSQGLLVPIIAASLGASVIEKHFTIDKNLPGPDHKASIEPDELHELVKRIRIVETVLGCEETKPCQSELANLKAIRGSLVASRQISAGDMLTADNITVKRPGDGINPLSFLDINETIATSDYKKDEKIHF